MVSSKQIRTEFIKYFEELGHTFVPSSPVVPMDDPTLLFTNAGMNQFKDVFLNVGTRPYKRAANTQKCIRVSGKHNDLEEVGVDTYHHTFFEMLGNWSFGDYFKAEAIQWAWQLLTEKWGLPKNRLYATVFAGDDKLGLEPDEQAEHLWREVADIDPSHILRYGVKDNFWQMAETGPCGPCSEIHIDLTDDCSGGKLINAGDPRVIEIWNLVFIQFDLAQDGKLTPLPAKHIDTGMGLERICAVIKHIDELKSNKPASVSNYGTDLFVPIIQHIEKLSGCNYGSGAKNLPDRYDSNDCENIVDIACRVIADHIRTLTFAITDGALPSNEGRGYVLRRILRRAARYGRKLDMRDPFMYQLIPTVIDIMGDAFPEIKEKAEFVAQTIKAEEQAFGRTLDRGLEIFEQVANGISAKGEKIFPGDEAFKLYDTYGFPLDLTQLMARERGMTVDEQKFNELMEGQRQRARSADKQGKSAVIISDEIELPATDDSAKYNPDMQIQGKLIGWVIDGKWIDDGTISAPQKAALVFDKTCFYAESGGQVGDKGKIITSDAEFIVEDTQKVNDAVLHIGQLVKGALSVGQTLDLLVNKNIRKDTMNNHTATHLLQWALREVLGGHVKQAGSLVCDEYLRFDFTHNQAMTDEQITRVEELIIEKIDQAHNIVITQLPIEEALQRGITALFGEKYGDVVRVIAIGADDAENIDKAFSKELCGGTHISNTASIMDFKIIREESLQTGVRRITAKTGRKLRELMHQRYDLTVELSQILKVQPEKIGERLTALMEENRKLKKQIQQGPAIDITAETQKLLDKAKKIGDVTVVIGELPHVPVEKLRGQIDWLRKKTDTLIAVLGTRNDSKVQLISAVDDKLIKQGVSAGKLIRQIAQIVGGGGGGKDHLAQAGGKLPEKLPQALESAEKIIRDALEKNE